MLFRALSRRRFLKVATASGALLASGLTLEACGGGEAPTFFTPDERATIEAALARIVPGSDTDPGAREAGVINYIERLLTAFDYDPPLIFAGGPFSGRTPFPDSDAGEPSTRFPKNDFRTFLPLPRTRELAWRIRIFGSAATPGGDFNDAALGATAGWRDRYRAGTAEIVATSQELFQTKFVELSAAQRDEVLAAVGPAFVSLLAEHAVEGMYAPPEYGGNRDLLGWLSVNFEGDSQPLGYSVFNETTGEYEELPDHPMSTENPDKDFAGFDEETLQFISDIARVTGGERFF